MYIKTTPTANFLCHNCHCSQGTNPSHVESVLVYCLSLLDLFKCQIHTDIHASTSGAFCQGSVV